MEKVRIELDREAFNRMLVNNRFDRIAIYEDNHVRYIDIKYEIKEVVIEDDLFKDDSIYQELKSKSINAYKDLKKYEFNKRTNHKN